MWPAGLNRRIPNGTDGGVEGGAVRSPDSSSGAGVTARQRMVVTRPFAQQPDSTT